MYNIDIFFKYIVYFLTIFHNVLNILIFVSEMILYSAIYKILQILLLTPFFYKSIILIGKTIPPFSAASLI